MTDAQAEQIWDYWYPLLYGYFFRRINDKDDVEEMVSNVLTIFLTKENIENPKAFMWGVARNQLILYYNEKSKLPQVQNYDLSPDYYSQMATTQDMYSEYEKNYEGYENIRSSNYLSFIQKLKVCIENHLKDKDKEIVVESIVHDKNSTILGQQLNLKPATVRQRLKRAVDKLKSKCVDIWTEMQTIKA